MNTSVRLPYDHLKAFNVSDDDGIRSPPPHNRQHSFLSALYLLKRCMDFDQLCTDTLLDRGKNLLDFGDLDLIFKVTGGQRMMKNSLSAPYLLKEIMDFDNFKLSGLFK